MRRLVLLSFVLLLPLSAYGLNIGDTTVVIPIIGRFAGVPPSIWRTDVFIANHYSPTVTITMNFYVTGGATLTATTIVPPFGAVALRDIVLSTFGLSAAAGQLELKSNGTTFEARARIYNKGLAIGEFAQSAPGIGLAHLRSQGFVYGLSGIDGNRANVGVANPNAIAVTGTMRISDKNNTQLTAQSVTLQPHETQQFNDIFTRFGITPQADVQVEFNSFDAAKPIYLYASEVRNDTGDAIFLFGTAPNL